MPDPLVDNPRAFAEQVAAALGGGPVEQGALSGFASSDFDPFLNHLFASAALAPGEAAEALAGRPGFVWLTEDPVSEAERAQVVLMQGMTANVADAPVEPVREGLVAEARSDDDLDDWHEVYSEVFGSDPRSRDDWRRVHATLGSSADGSLLLLVARVDGAPAATGAVFFHQDVAGLYCFTTRESMRGRGLATELVHAAHAAVRARNVEHTVLQATPSGRPVYARAGYADVRPLPVLAIRR